MTRGSRAKSSTGDAGRAPGRIALALAILLLVVLPLVPGAFAAGSAAPLIGLPAESILVVLLLLVLRRRPVRVVVAVGFGILIVLALALAGIDAVYESVLDTPFDPLHWRLLGDGYGVVRDSIGEVAANGVVVLLAIVAAGTVAALAWAALRAGTSLRRNRDRGARVLSIVTAVWIVAAVTGAHLVAGQPAAEAVSIRAIGASAARAAAGLESIADLPHQIATDPYARTPASDLLTALRGKDVVFAFIESYGRVAVEGSAIADGVHEVLAAGDVQLTADGYSAQSAYLTSPTFGGLSWLAHSSLQTGLWIDRQPLYSALIRSDRFTLSRAFGGAGWRTVSVDPANTKPWSFGTSFYRYDALLDERSLGYRGPAFGYARIPDQYTWKYLADHVLAAGHPPTMAEVDLISSHTPWAPLPELVPWSQVGDGSVFGPQPARGPTVTEVWQDPEHVQQAYARSIRYSLGAMFAFLHEVDDPNLVVVVLGDHQPATVVTGRGASHDVPISVIAKDPAVFAAIDGWKWQQGMAPDAEAPVWRMSDFRDRFLDAFSSR